MILLGANDRDKEFDGGTVPATLTVHHEQLFLQFRIGHLIVQVVELLGDIAPLAQPVQGAAPQPHVFRLVQRDVQQELRVLLVALLRQGHEQTFLYIAVIRPHVEVTEEWAGVTTLREPLDGPQTHVLRDIGALRVTLHNLPRLGVAMLCQRQHRPLLQRFLGGEL